jgi:hypothetical protein
MDQKPSEDKIVTPAEQVDAATRRKAAAQLHKQKAEERKRLVEQRKGEYAQIKDSPALADIISKGKEFAAYHLKLAKDGMGARITGQDENNQPVVEDYFLTSDQRIAELDQAKGIEQYVAYIENQLQ